MIKSVKVLDPDHTPVGWWKDVFPEPRSWEFAPGMNILWGKNGSGKTTLIKLLARMMHCEQGGVSTVTERSIRELRADRFSDLRVEVEVEHDGTAAVYYDPTNTIGLETMRAALDYDFMDAGLMNTISKASSGQLALGRLHDVMKRYKPEVQYKIRGDAPERVQELLKASIDKGPQTLLMDEPDANLDWPTKLNWWTRLDLLALEGRFQLIIATHSILALRLIDANFINIPEDDGYLQETHNSLVEAGFLSDEPISLDQVMARMQKVSKEGKKSDDAR